MSTIPVGKKTEDAILLDISTSMNWPAAEGHHGTRKGLVIEALGIIVEDLTKDDTEAEALAAAGQANAGIMTVVFSDTAQTLGDMTPENWKREIENVQWEGGTQIMPGWNLIVKDFREEFGKMNADERPVLKLLVITDGEAEDMEQFEAACAQVKGEVFIDVAIVGYGGAHDRVLAAYQALSQTHPHVRVISFDSVTDPNALAASLTDFRG
jgi:uncharacterized protein YegL